jgi:6,7-dimethyl-8-ribityllumazine synthase
MRKGSLKYQETGDARELAFAVVAARWNAEITEKLLDGALSVLHAAGARKRDVRVLRVPGSFELVSACRLAVGRKVSAVVALGCLLRGETPHFEILAHAVASAIANLNAIQNVPIAFGVLTCENRRQALDRCGGKSGHVGREAAQAAIAMARLGKNH